MLRNSAISASAWTLCGYGFGQALRLGSHLILAWLLAPSVFGLMALVKVFMQGLEMFSDVGIQPSIIRSKRGEEPVFLNTAWSIQVGRGVILWCAACLLAWPVASWFSDNSPAAGRLIYIIPVAAFVTVLQGFQSTTLATLTRQIKMGQLTILEVATQLVSLAVMIVWALLHPTVWAMVAGGLAGAAFRTVVSHLVLPGHRPTFCWDRDCVAELFTFGRWIFLSTVFTFLAGNLDKLILGRVLSLAELGLYSIAFVFARFPLHICARLSAKVLYPLYSRYRDDPGRMIEVAVRAQSPILHLGLAVSLCVAIGSRLFFESLWDDRYLGIASISRVMAVYIWMMILLITIDRIPLALGNSRAVFVSNVIQCCGVAFAVAGYIGWQLPGFVGGLAMGPGLSLLFMIWTIPGQRFRLLRTAGQLSMVGVAYGAMAITLTERLFEAQHYGWWGSAVIALCAAPLLVAGVNVWSSLTGQQKVVPAGELTVSQTIA